MGRATGPISSETMTEAVGIRCPIGDCKVINAPIATGSDVVAGEFHAMSNMLVVALESRAAAATDQNAVGAYEIPALKIGPAYPVSARASETWVQGQRLGYNSGSNLVVALTSDFSVMGYTLEPKAANASECLIHFKGDGVVDISIVSA